MMRLCWPVTHFFFQEASKVCRERGKESFEEEDLLWSTQGGTFKLANPKHKHRTEHQSLVDSLSLSFLVYWTKINNSQAKLM